MLRFFLIVLFSSLATYSFQTSSESVNPFNQFMSPSGGVNMYSGDAAYSLPVASVSGRGGMSAAVNLSYSSNIYLNVRSRNDVAPASWVGLGWNLNYGSIKCDHKGTKTHDDDEFFWISPAGFSSKILKKNGKYYIKEDPYTKIEPQVGSDSVFTGWILTTTDGQKARYGNFGFTDNRKATRWTFAWGNYVGTGSTGTPTQYPYQWDLSEVADVNGNAVNYYYQQDTEYVKVGSWTSPTTYTKASYPKKIVTPEGKWIEFALESKGTEVYDPYTFLAEPDGFMEMVELKRLSQIKVYLLPGSTTAASMYKFAYDTINGSALGPDFKKSLLVGIETYNGSGTTVLSKTQFTYNTDFGKGNKDDAVHYDTNYHYGALNTIANSNGGLITMRYERKSLPITKLKQFDTTQHGTYLTCGITDDVNPFFLVTEDPDNNDRNSFYLSQWTGSKWTWEFHNSPISSEVIDPFTGVDYYAIRGGSNHSQMRIFSWDGYVWDSTVTLNPLNTIVYAANVVPGRNFIVVHGDPATVIKDRFRVYIRNGQKWDTTAIIYPFGSGRLIDNIEENIRDNFFVVRGGANHQNMRIYTINGTTLTASDTLNPFNAGTPINIYSSNNYIVVRGNDPTLDRLCIYTRNGTVWDKGNTIIPFAAGSLIDNIPENMQDNYFVVRGSGNNHCKFRVFRRTGEGWSIGDSIMPFTNTAQAIDIYSAADYFVVRGGSALNALKIFTWNGGAWDSTKGMVAFGDANLIDNVSLTGRHIAVRGTDHHNWVHIYSLIGTSWSTTDSVCPFSDGAALNIYPGNNFFAFRGGTELNALSIYEWVGNGWEVEAPFLPINVPYGNDIHTGSNYIVFRGNAAHGIGAYFKFQDKFSNEKIYSYTVNSKKVQGGVFSGDSVVVKFEYNLASGNYDTRAGTAKFNKVETIIPGNGKTVQYFFNHTTNDTQNTHSPDWQKLDGLVYRTAAYNQANVSTESKSLSSGSTDYVVYHDTMWVPGMIHKRVNSTTSTTHGITSVNEILAYNATNGMPYKTRTKNSDGKQKLSKTFFAFENASYSTAMGASGANMLTSPCQTIVYEKALGVTTDEPLAGDIRSAQATTWDNTLGTTAWMPAKSYVWKSDFKADGTLDKTYADFVHTAGASNTNWQLTGSADKYNSYGASLQASDAMGKPSCTIYRNDLSIPIASVNNASWLESGVFTCDYDLDEAGSPFKYFDKENGWEKGTDILVNPNVVRGVFSTTVTHFGQKSIGFSNGEGMMRNFKIRAGVAYELSAWVNVSNGVGDGFQMWAECHKGTPTSTTWPFPYSALPEQTDVYKSTAITTTNGQWQLVKLTVPAQTAPASGDIWIRVTIGRNGYTFSANVDDIRFAPVGSQLSTTYYDQLWQQPIMSVDANDNPSKRVEYDDFGRPVTTYKMNKATTELTPLNEKEYHLMKDAAFPDPAKWYKIVSKAESSRCIDILGSQAQDHALLHMYTFANTPNQLWQFTSAAGGYYYIKTKVNPSANININDPDGTKMVGTQLEVFPASTIWQMWKITAVGDGCYRISSNVKIGNVIECSAAAELSPVQLGSYKAGDRQKWQIIEVP